MMLTDPEIRVVIFRSAIPGYFMPHYNVGEIVQGMGGLSPISAIEDNILMSLLEEFRTGGKVTIAVIEGRAGGGGAETTYAMDMRFASEDAIFCQPEVAIGICPGAGASSRLARLIGRSRAMEMCLACDDIDAHTAEKWGVVNRTLPRDKIWPFVNNLAKRIASFPMHAIRETKRSVNQLEVYNGHAASVLGDQNMFRITVNEGMEVMRKFVEMGGDTPVVGID